VQRHPVDLVSLIAGVVALGIALAVLTGIAVGLAINGTLLFPLAIAVAGGIGLVVTVLRHRGAPPT
jgi:transketolase C-terminal domain/subunit